jgi:hypothetical protein
VPRVETLERVLFITFVVAANAFVAINLGWALLTTSWNSIFADVIPVLGLVTLASYLAFALLEDHLGARRYRVGLRQ